jgi:hypothetical protein
MAGTGSNIRQLAPSIDLLDGNGERWTLSGTRGVERPEELAFRRSAATPGLGAFSSEAF